MELFDEKAIQEAMRMANSPAGKQLIKLLQQSSGADLQKVMAQAAAGDYTGAKQAIETLADSPEVKKHLKQMGRDRNG